VGTPSAPQTVTLTNTGTAILNITSLTITGANAGDFSQTNTCPSSLAAGANCTIAVLFTPAVVGPRAAALTLVDNASGSPHTVNLSGTGTAPGAGLSPTGLTFTSQAIGATSAAQTLTLTNTGNGNLSITTIAITGANAGDFGETTTCPLSPSTVAANGTCTISVTFTPTATGSRAATVTLTDNASNSPQTAGLTGTGTVVTLAITSTSLASGILQQAYSAQGTATGGTTPYTWSITAGALPAGLSLNASTGAITGTPTQASTASFTLQVQDSGSPVQTATANVSITINCPTGQACGAKAAFCQSYTPPSTSGATAITSLPYVIHAPGNYYLASSLSTSSGAAVGISIQASNVDINLNGNTLTYGVGGSSATSAVGQYGIISCDTGNLGAYSLAAAYGTNGYCTSSSAEHNITIENGTVTQSPQASGYDNFAACPGASVGGNYAPNPCAPGSNNGDTYATTFSHNIAIFGGYNIKVTHVTFNFQQVSSDGLIDNWEQTGGDVITCNTFNNGVVHIDNRAFIEGASIWGDNNYNATVGDTVQYNTVVGGPQLGILSSTPGAAISNNDIDIGVGAAGQVQYTDDFAITPAGASQTVANNYIHNLEGRAIGGSLDNLTNSGNYISTVEYANNYEYNTAAGNHPGCAYLGTSGVQYRYGGLNGMLSGLNIAVSAGACPAAALEDFGWGQPTNSANSIYAAHAIAGFTGGVGQFEYEATALWLASGTGLDLGDFISTNDTFIGDSSIVYVDYFGLTAGQTVTLISPTLTKGSNPVNFNTFRFQNSGANVCAGCIHIRDATFTNGASATDADMIGPIQDNTMAEYFIDWTYTLTVTSGGHPVSGATVSIVDHLGNTVFTGNTNASGQITAVLTQFRMYSTTAGKVQENRTPDAVAISNSGCTTLNYNVTLASTTADTRTLSCP